MATFEEIQEAFFFVSSQEYGMHSAVLCLDDGKYITIPSGETSMNWMKTSLTVTLS